MKTLLALGILLLDDSPASQEHAARQPAPLEFRAECTFSVEIVDRIVADLSIHGGDERIAALLLEHSCEHGWALDRYSPDFVDAAHAVPCSNAVLERLASAKLPHDWT